MKLKMIKYAYLKGQMLKKIIKIIIKIYLQNSKQNQITSN